ncbi:MAG: ferritin-like domain-containing protein [Proteobacteria bacterium]|nr:ferritin-like domain-containing protein [Pseudomonadota bacterium]
MSDFILDVQNIRNSARDHLKNGAVTKNYQANRETVLAILDAALASEWLCVLRYTQHSKTAKGIQAEPIAKHFAEHAEQEMEHAELIANRIKQLGGDLNLDPSSFAQRGHTEYLVCESIMDMIKENLIAERIAIDVYGAAIRFIGDHDSTTRRILETILAVEEEHADELSDLLSSFKLKDALN